MMNFPFLFVTTEGDFDFEDFLTCSGLTYDLLAPVSIKKLRYPFVVGNLRYGIKFKSVVLVSEPSENLIHHIRHRCRKHHLLRPPLPPPVVPLHSTLHSLRYC